jgi:hypothetical protein
MKEVNRQLPAIRVYALSPDRAGQIFSPANSRNPADWAIVEVDRRDVILLLDAR